MYSKNFFVLSEKIVHLEWNVRAVRVSDTSDTTGLQFSLITPRLFQLVVVV